MDKHSLFNTNFVPSSVKLAVGRGGVAVNSSGAVLACMVELLVNSAGTILTRIYSYQMNGWHVREHPDSIHS